MAHEGSPSEVYFNEILRRFNENERLANLISEIVKSLQVDGSNLTAANKERILTACNSIVYLSSSTR